MKIKNTADVPATEQDRILTGKEKESEPAEQSTEPAGQMTESAEQSTVSVDQTAGSKKTFAQRAAHAAAKTAVLSALGCVLYLLRFPIPFLFPSFLDFQISDLPCHTRRFFHGTCGRLRHNTYKVRAESSCERFIVRRYRGSGRYNNRMFVCFGKFDHLQKAQNQETRFGRTCFGQRDGYSGCSCDQQVFACPSYGRALRMGSNYRHDQYAFPECNAEQFLQLLYSVGRDTVQCFKVSCYGGCHFSHL